MSSLTTDLIEAASGEYDEDNIDRAIYLLLLALVTASDRDVNVADTAQTALAEHRLSSPLSRSRLT